MVCVILIRFLARLLSACELAHLFDLAKMLDKPCLLDNPRSCTQLSLLWLFQQLCLSFA